MNLAAIPSPTQSAWPIFGFPIRAYALCIIAGIVVALFLTARRWRARGGDPGTVADVATWAVPFGLVGARLYHVITDWQLYFAEGKNPVDALKIWEGGLGVWGAIAGGAVGAWIACRRKGISLAAFADAAAPGIVLAQALGRWGNWFNNELYGGPTDLPWALTIHQIDPATSQAVLQNGEPVVLGQFHPTFLYEFLWCVGVAVLVLWADRRFRLGHGRAFALYVAGYTLGRGWIEALRIDPANEFFGLRLNNWTSAVVFIGAVVFLVLTRHLGREPAVEGGAVEPDEPAESVADAETVDAVEAGAEDVDVADATDVRDESAPPATDDELDDVAVQEASQLADETPAADQDGDENTPGPQSTVRQ